MFWLTSPLILCSKTTPSLQRICVIVSASLSHMGHRASFTTPLRIRFIFVGRRLLHALHKNIFAAFRILRFQIFFQIVVPSHCSDPPSCRKDCSRYYYTFALPHSLVTTNKLWGRYTIERERMNVENFIQVFFNY
jgi:hypothetical protein